MPRRKSLKPKASTEKKHLAQDSPAKNTRSNSGEFHAIDTDSVSPAKSPRKRKITYNDRDAKGVRATTENRSRSVSPSKRAVIPDTDPNIVPIQYTTETRDTRTVHLPDTVGVTGLWPPPSLGTSPFDSPGRRLGSFDSIDRPSAPRSTSLQTLQKRSKSSKKSAPVQTDVTDPFQPGSLSIEHQQLLTHLSGRDRHHKYPKIMSLGEISECYHAIQGATHIYANQYFAFDMTAKQRANWPLHELRTHYPALYLGVQYMFDGGQAGWRDFFTRPQYRKHLVTAIISEWMTQRIFKHTAFGINERDVDELEDVDREYIHYDAIVRSKKKAKLLTEMLYKSDVSRRAHIESIRRDVDALADELVIVLDPLLPPSRHVRNDHDGRSDSQRNDRESTRHFHKVLIRDTILIQAANLALSIRVSSQDGTVIRTVPPVPNGSRYTGSASMICVNAERCVSAPLAYRKDKTLCVKMNCWPRIEAIQPHGPDINELEILEAEGQAELIQRNKESPGKSQIFSWNHQDSCWPELPEDLHHMVKDDHNDEDDNSESDSNRSNWDSRPKRKASHDLVPPSKKVKRAAYITTYPRICCATVYCEWVSNHQISRPQTLAEAVAEARRQWSPFLHVEDQYINLRNHIATFSGGYQWLLLAALIYGVSQHGPLTLTKQILNSATKNLLNPFPLIARWTYADRIPIREAFLTHVLGAGATSTPTSSQPDAEDTETVHPLVLLRALQPYIAPRSRLRNMSGSELTTHLSRALTQFLKDTFEPFGQVSFSIPAAVKEALGHGRDRFNSTTGGGSGSGSGRANAGTGTSGSLTGAASKLTLVASTVSGSADVTRTLVGAPLGGLYSSQVSAVGQKVVTVTTRTKATNRR